MTLVVQRMLVERFLERACRAPDALAFAVYPAGATRASERVTWGMWSEAVHAAAIQLVDAGVGRGERVAVFAGNRLLWPIADMAMQLVGAIGVGIYPVSAQCQVEAMLSHATPSMVLVDGESRLDLLLRARSAIASSATSRAAPPFAVIADVEARVDDAGVRGWSAWLDEGRARLAGDPDAQRRIVERAATVTLDDVAALVYTSGSTGEPKGAELSQRCLAASAESIVDVLELTSADSSISFLPFSHAAERVFGQCTRIRAGMSSALVEDPAELFAVAADFEPTLLGGLPRIFERLHDVAEAARRCGGDARAAVQERIGRRCRLATSGGAALPGRVAESLEAVGLRVIGAYGQTEHLCVAMHRPGSHGGDSVGFPMPGTELRTAEGGELLVRRSALTFSGYYRDPDATRAAFTADGAWLRTGDLGRIDAEGRLHITGRVKELIALSTGRKVAPLPIETRLSACPLIAQAVCHGEGRKFLTVLLSLHRAATLAWAREEGIDAEWPSVTGHPALREELQKAIDDVNAGLARTDCIRAFAVVPDEFTVEGGELTATLKLRRSVIAQRYAHLLDGLYE